MRKCQISPGYGPLGGRRGIIAGSCPGAPWVKIVIVDNECHYIPEERIICGDSMSSVSCSVSTSSPIQRVGVDLAPPPQREVDFEEW